MPVNPPFFEVATVGGQSVILSQGAIGYIRTDPAAPTARCFVGTFAMDAGEPWHIDAPADALANALSAAGGFQPGNQPGQVLFAGVVLGNGTIAGGYQAPGVSFTAGPYLPASGHYSFSLNGLGPISMCITATPTQGPALQETLSAVQVNPTQLEVWGDSIPAGAWGDWAFYLLVVRA
jgi:hypothetical protein